MTRKESIEKKTHGRRRLPTARAMSASGQAKWWICVQQFKKKKEKGQAGVQDDVNITVDSNGRENPGAKKLSVPAFTLAGKAPGNHLA